MKKDYPDTINALKNCIGKTIKNLTRIQSYFNDNEDDDGFGDLELMFTDNSYLTLSGEGDATSIRANNTIAKVPKTFNVTDNDICSWKRIELKEQKWLKMANQKLESVEVEWESESLVACKLNLQNDFITFFENGSDANKFFINEPLIDIGNKTTIEKLK